jgi:hypothetical protein
VVLEVLDPRAHLLEDRQQRRDELVALEPLDAVLQPLHAKIPLVRTPSRPYPGGVTDLRRITVLTVIALAAIGCSGGDDDTDAAEASTTTAVDETTTTEATATVGQFASIVAQYRPHITELLPSVGDCELDLVSGQRCGEVSSIDMLTLSITAETLRTVLSGAGDPSSRTFVGAVPAEIEDLVADTLEEAGFVAEQANIDGTTEPCRPDGSTAGTCAFFFLHVRSLERVLAGWDPYL